MQGRDNTQCTVLTLPHTTLTYNPNSNSNPDLTPILSLVGSGIGVAQSNVAAVVPIPEGIGSYMAWIGEFGVQSWRSPPPATSLSASLSARTRVPHPPNPTRRLDRELAL